MHCQKFQDSCKISHACTVATIIFPSNLFTAAAAAADKGLWRITIQLTFNFSKSTIGTLEKCVKYVPS